MTKIIAFAGRKQSGKTSCSNFVKTLFPDDENFVKVYNFADPLKQDVCMNLLGLTYEQCYGDDEQKNTLTDILWNEKLLTAREVMQLVGTDLFRAMKHDVWTSSTIQKIQTEQKKIALIADCRFPNEVKAVKESGGVIIKLTRNPFNSDHLSETALDHENYDQRNFDTIITNHYMSIDNQNDVIYKYLRKKGLLSL